jgi:crossover junction endodeoxyribonuclease RuvC
MSELVIGIDPGLTGALAILGPSGEVITLADLPVSRSPGKLTWLHGAALHDILVTHITGQTTAVVEVVHAMPKQGVSSTFTFGCVYGSLLAVLQVLHVSIHLISPSIWKRDLKLIGKDKKAALAKARLLFPNAALPLAKHHGRAEALLLATWYMQTFPQPKKTPDVPGLPEAIA